VSVGRAGGEVGVLAGKTGVSGAGIWVGVAGDTPQADKINDARRMMDKEKIEKVDFMGVLLQIRYIGY
jgi:hypothetical protein